MCRVRYKKSSCVRVLDSIVHDFFFVNERILYCAYLCAPTPRVRRWRGREGIVYPFSLPPAANQPKYLDRFGYVSDSLGG